MYIYFYNPKCVYELTDGKFCKNDSMTGVIADVSTDISTDVTTVCRQSVTHIFAVSQSVSGGKFAVSHSVSDGKFAISQSVSDGKFAVSQSVTSVTLPSVSQTVTSITLPSVSQSVTSVTLPSVSQSVTSVTANLEANLSMVTFIYTRRSFVEPQSKGATSIYQI